MSYFKILMIGFFIFTFSFLGWANAKSGPSDPDSLFINSRSGGNLPFNPAAAKWQYVKGELTVFVMNTSGGIDIWGYSDGEWRENQTLTAPGGLFSYFELRDLERDNLPELIAGTTDNGFIYLYHFINDTWTLQNSEKYVWSTITCITAGHLDESESGYILVQSREGFLFLFRQVEQSLDLVWKSPNVWRPFASVFVADIDGDHKDEITVSYQNGAVAVLKMVNNSIVTVWENYVWGKILACTAADWENNQHAELIFSTTQKMIYFLGYTDKGFQFETQLSQFPFIAESLAVPDLPDEKELLVVDTSGKFHVLSNNLTTNKWVEIANLVTGRTIQTVINPENQQIWLWGSQTGTFLNVIHTREIRLNFQGEDYPAGPPLLYQNGHWYLAPRSLAGMEPLKIQIRTDKNAYRINIASTIIEISKKLPISIKLNGLTREKPENCLVINDEPYLSFELWQRFLNLQLHSDDIPPYLEISLPDSDQP